MQTVGSQGKPEQARGPTVFVWLAWSVMLAAELLFVSRYGSSVPTWDAWDVVPVLTGDQPFDLRWLFAPHNEHRMPLPKGALVVLTWSSGDLRAAQVFAVLVLAALAAGMIIQARRVRGRTSWTDAFLPAALMHLGQYELILTGALSLAFSTALAGLLLALVADGRALVARPAAVAFGLGLLALPLCGANGAAFVPALAAWLGWAVWRRRGAGGPDSRRAAVIPLTLVALALAEVALYFGALPAAPHHPRSADAVSLLRTAIQFCSMSFGPAGAIGWPWLVPVLAGLVLAGCASLVRTWRREPAARPRTLGFFAFLAGFASLAVGVAWGRSGLGPSSGLEDRYVTLASPLLCWLFFVAATSANPGGRWLEGALGSLGVALAIFDAVVGVRAGEQWRAFLRPVEQAIYAGLPPAEIATRFRDRLHPGLSPEVIASRLEMLRDAGLAPYGDGNARGGGRSGRAP